MHIGKKVVGKKNLKTTTKIAWRKNHPKVHKREWKLAGKKYKKMKLPISLLTFETFSTVADNFSFLNKYVNVYMYIYIHYACSRHLWNKPRANEVYFLKFSIAFTIIIIIWKKVNFLDIYIWNQTLYTSKESCCGSGVGGVQQKKMVDWLH